MIPDPLPARATATLDAGVRALIVHDVLDDGRHLLHVDELRVVVSVDRDDGSLRLDSFPDVEEEVDTALGSIRVVVSVEGEPVGRYDDSTRHVEIDVPLHLDAKSFFASDSDVHLTLKSDAQIDEDGLTGTGDPFDAGDPTVRLVGNGTLDGGSLDGAPLWLVLEGTVVDVRKAS